ncbi:MAG: SET domain-containing protein-lysine N-methyltransferase [Pseudomonadota bacterium]
MRGNQITGMCAPYIVREISGKGRGVFADAAIRKGSTVWRHVPGQFEVLNEVSFERLLANSSREDAIDLLIHIVSVEEFPGYMIRYFDEGALINHSSEPNVKKKCEAEEYQHSPINSDLDISKALCDSHFSLVAACDLAAGDELVMDYNAEPDDPEYYQEACRRYGVTWDQDWL